MRQRVPAGHGWGSRQRERDAGTGVTRVIQTRRPCGLARALQRARRTKRSSRRRGLVGFSRVQAHSAPAAAELGSFGEGGLVGMGLLYNCFVALVIVAVIGGLVVFFLSRMGPDRDPDETHSGYILEHGETYRAYVVLPP